MGYGTSKKKLIFLRYKDSSFGGAERYLHRLNATLNDRGYETEILHANLPDWLPSWLKVLLFSRKICRLRSQIQNPESRIFFSLDRITCPDVYRAGDGVHKAFLSTKGFTLNPLHLSYLWLEKHTFTKARLIIANSRMVKNQILQYYPRIEEKKIQVVYNGVPIPEKIDKTRAKNDLASEFGFDPDLPIFLFVGSGFKRKGVDEFLRILSHLQKPFRAFVVGKERKIKRYKKMAESIGISEYVIFTGPQKNVERFYEAADIFLFPTHYEPFSNVVLEAMGYGNVTFTTRQNGASEILPTEWIMERPEDLSVAGRINQLLSLPQSLAEEQTQARKIASCYPIQRNVEETLELLRRYFG